MLFRSKTSLVFPTNKSYVKTIDSINTVYQKSFANVRAYSGVATVNISSTEKFVGPASAGIPLSLSRPNYIIVNKQKIDTNPSYAEGDYMSMDDLTLELDANRQSLTIDFGSSTIEGYFDIVVTTENSATEPRVKTLVEDYGNVYNVANVSEWYSLQKTDIFSLKSIYKIDDVELYNGDYNESNTYVSNSLVKANSSLYLNISGSSVTGVPVSNTTVWSPTSPESLLL